MLIPIGLIVVGLLLIAIEVYVVPGFNVVGLLGLAMMLFAVGFAFSTAGLLGGVAMLGLSTVSSGGLFYFLWKSGAWNRFVLDASLQADEKLLAEESEQRARFLGKLGVAITPLRPTGVVEIEGERIEANTEGDYIAAGSDIRVVAMDRRRYFVRLAALEG
ncbi:MAG: NfeD family protein [Bacteroidota bacterium]